eukprot:2967836-Amphidinium_carterae.1
MEGFNNPGLDVGWKTKPTHPVHGQFKSADPLPLHRVPLARPLSINPQITRGDFNWGPMVENRTPKIDKGKKLAEWTDIAKIDPQKSPQIWGKIFTG